MRNKAYEAEQGRNRREWYKEHYICTNCGRNDAEPGRTYCAKCLAEYRAKHQARRDAYNTQKKEMRHARIAAGLCPQCGHPARPGFRMCGRCNASRNDSVRKFRIKKRLEDEANAARAGIYKP